MFLWKLVQFKPAQVEFLLPHSDYMHTLIQKKNVKQKSAVVNHKIHFYENIFFVNVSHLLSIRIKALVLYSSALLNAYDASLLRSESLVFTHTSYIPISGFLWLLVINDIYRVEVMRWRWPACWNRESILKVWGSTEQHIFEKIKLRKLPMAL